MNEPKYRKITIDIEDGNSVTHIEKDNEDFLKQYYQLQSNWNSLREWLKNEIKQEHHTKHWDMLDKMNELERNESNEKKI